MLLGTVYPPREELASCRTYMKGTVISESVLLLSASEVSCQHRPQLNHSIAALPSF